MKNKEHHILVFTCANLLKGDLQKIHRDFCGLWIVRVAGGRELN